MRRRAIASVCAWCLLGGAPAGQQTSLPTHSFTLPLARVTADSPVLQFSERRRVGACQLTTYITGAFGGQMATGLLATVREVPLAVTVGKTRARSARAIVYCPGYEYALVHLPALGSRRLIVPVDLRPRSPVTLRGTIAFPEGPVPAGVLIRLRYFMEWAHGFFGITDGMVPVLELETHPIQDDGSFELDAPDVGADSALAGFPRLGSLWLEIVGVKTGSPAYGLRTRLEPSRPVLQIPAGRSYPYLWIQATPLRAGR